MAGLTRDVFNLDGAVEYFRNFKLKQAPQHIFVRTRYGYLRPTAFLAHANAQNAQFVALAVALAQHLLFTRHGGFGAAELQNYRAAAYGLHSAMDDFALAFGVFLILRIALGFLELLQHKLLCSLCCNASKVGWC